MLSDSPPERDLEWTEAGVDGAWRFVNRLWRLALEPRVTLALGDGKPNALSARADATLRLTHKTIAAVGDNLEKFRFNSAVARIYELSNAIAELSDDAPGEAWVYGEALRVLILLVSPMMPHLSEELWSTLGQPGMVCDQTRPRRAGVAGDREGARGPAGPQGRGRAEPDHQCRRLVRASARGLACAPSRSPWACSPQACSRFRVGSNRCMARTAVPPPASRCSRSASG
jgi:leucyl-tRNA synthetase